MTRCPLSPSLHVLCPRCARGLILLSDEIKIQAASPRPVSPQQFLHSHISYTSSPTHLVDLHPAPLHGMRLREMPSNVKPRLSDKSTSSSPPAVASIYDRLSRVATIEQDNRVEGMMALGNIRKPGYTGRGGRVNAQHRNVFYLCRDFSQRRRLRWQLHSAGYEAGRPGPSGVQVGL